MPTPQRLYSAQQLGLLLRAARKTARLTQAELGERMNLSQARVSALELAPENLSVEQLLAWASVVGLDLHIGARGVPGAPNMPKPTGASSEW